MKKAFVFDFDDTLATTSCQVIVKDLRGRFVKSLTPSEFNDHELSTVDHYDFSEFRSSEFIRSANPTSLMELARQVYEEDHSVYILTARADNVEGAIKEWLKEFGIIAKGLYCVGKDNEKISIAEEKQKILQSIKLKYDLVYFYDDNKENIDLANKTGVKTYLV